MIKKWYLFKVAQSWVMSLTLQHGGSYEVWARESLVNFTATALDAVDSEERVGGGWKGRKGRGRWTNRTRRVCNNVKISAVLLRWLINLGQSGARAQGAVRHNTTPATQTQLTDYSPPHSLSLSQPPNQPEATTKTNSLGSILRFPNIDSRELK